MDNFTWKKFYKDFKPCHQCGSGPEYLDVDYEDSIQAKAYGRCFNCGNTGPSVQHSARDNKDYTLEILARDAWNDEWEQKATKLLKHLIGYDDI